MPKNEYKISISKVRINESTKRAVLDILESGYLVAGKNTASLEEKFSKLCQTKYSIAVTSGTSALHTAISILGIGYEDEVITTPFTYVATANAIALTGAIPVFIDIDPITFNIDPEKIEAAITPKTKAILAVDLYGLPAEYKKIKKIARKHHLFVIEDAAQAVGASYYGKRTGSLADIGCFSLYATKNLMSGEGGMVTTNSKAVEVKARRFRNHGEYSGVNYSYKGVGHNYCPTDMVGAIGLGQLEDFSTRTKRRQEIAERYSQAFEKIKGLIVPSVPKWSNHVFHQYTIRITKEFSCSRDVFQKKMLEKGITTRIYYPLSLHRLRHLNQQHTHYHLPQANKAAREVVSIPVHPYLTDNEVSHIINCVRDMSQQEL